MRTIKFRGFNKKNNEWLYGYYLVNRGQHFVVEDGIAPVGNTWQDYEIAPDTLGQFTGLQDKNGKDIYEGDIIQLDYPSWNYVVFWDDSSLSFQYRKAGAKQTYQLVMTELQLHHYEVVGNVHTNPELLNTK